jgi:tetratricopeptide (TPR) repeat protein
MTDYRIFVSHSHHDNDFCRRVVDYIKHGLPGADVFFDERELIGGDEWMRRIQHEVIDRPMFVVILSPNSVESSWVREETNLALSEAMKHRERRIIPVRYQDCDVTRLAALLLNRQIIDCASPDESTGLRQLVDALRRSSSPELAFTHASGPGEAQHLATQVHTAYSTRNWEETIRLGRVALQLQGNERNGDILGEVGIALIESGNVDEGSRKLDAALIVQATRADFWQARARLLCKDPNRIDDAIASWESALGLTRDVAQKLEILGEMFEAVAPTKRSTDALKIADEMIRLSPNSAEGWTYRGQELARFGRSEEAIAANDRALALNPDDARLWRENGQLLLAIGKLDQAIAAYDRALALNPNDEAGWSAKARALTALSKYEDAIAAADLALALAPQDTGMWVAKGDALRAMGRYDEALGVYDRALAVAPNDARAVMAKGTTLAQLGRGPTSGRCVTLLCACCPRIYRF